MSTLFKMGQFLNHSLFRSPQVRTKLRKCGMGLLTWQPYILSRRRGLLRNSLSLSTESKELIGGLNCRISIHDTMYEGDLQAYLMVGLSGLKCIEAALQSTPGLNPLNILDLPCGCGRVGRYLSARFKNASITACDLMKEGVDFCAAQFAMRPVYSQCDLDALDLGQTYDLIWCGSLVTHLNAADIQSLLGFFSRHLSPGGMLVFTTHGECVAGRLKAGWDYGISETSAKKALSEYAEKGFSFQPYAGHGAQEQYGFSITSADWIREQASKPGVLKEGRFQPQAWDNHQDVFAFVKAARP